MEDSWSYIYNTRFLFILIEHLVVNTNQTPETIFRFVRVGALDLKQCYDTLTQNFYQQILDTTD